MSKKIHVAYTVFMLVTEKFGLKLASHPQNFDEFFSGMIEQPKPSSIHFAALSTIREANSDDILRDYLNANLTFCDSGVVAGISSLDKEPLKQYRGLEFLHAVLSQKKAPLRHFLIVSTESCLQRVTAAILSSKSNSIVVGSIVPEIKSNFASELDEWNSKIESAKPNLVWVGIGSPKQDLIIKGLNPRENCLYIAIGAAIEMYAGERPTSPTILTRLKLEWLFRLILEPKRLSKRYSRDFLFLFSYWAFRNWKKLRLKQSRAFIK